MQSVRFRIWVALPVASLVTAGFIGVSAAQTAPNQSFDGTYNGTTQLISSTSASCTPGQPVTLDVHDGRFHQAWQARQDFAVRIGSDGKFYAKTGSMTAQSDKHMMVVPVIQGQVSGNSLIADYGTRWCHYRLEATRV